MLQSLLAGLTLSAAALAAVQPSPTFNREVFPILQKHCQRCHRPGQIAPMSFLSYQSTRPWAKAIKAAVITRNMPPWSADPRYGRFVNDPSLTQSEIQTLVEWVDSGASEGGVTDKPVAVSWPDGWHIQPDVVVSMPRPIPVAAKGVVELTTVVIPNCFKTDTWVTAIEILPGNKSVVHHSDLYFVPHKRGAQYGVPQVQEKERDADGVAVERIGKDDPVRGLVGWEAIYVPGTIPRILVSTEARS